MKRIFINLTVVIIFLTILSACYKPAHSQFTSSTISYQFDEPRDYCQRSLSDTGLEMRCEEGEINIEFISIDDTSSFSDFLLKEYGISDGYIFEEIEGKQSNISLAIRTNPSGDEITEPAYIAIFPMRGSFYAHTEGFPVNGFEDKFDPIFKDLITSFEP